ncbi:putative mitochondrial biogenesis protein AIM24 [Dioscorea sansibarensis]
MAAPFFSTPWQPYVYQSPQNAVTPFQIFGGDGQIVQIILKSEEKAFAKPGTMCYMSGSIQMDYNFTPVNEMSLLQWLFGKSVTSIVFFNSGLDMGFVGIAAPSPARVLPIDLSSVGGEIVCQSDAFLCCLSDVTVTNTYGRRVPRDIPIEELILTWKLVGRGLAFMVAGGSGILCKKSLEDGEEIVADAANIVAMTTAITMTFTNIHTWNRVIFGGDIQLAVQLKGPGIVFVQSLPFKRLSRTISRSISSPGLRAYQKFFLLMGLIILSASVITAVALLLTEV